MRLLSAPLVSLLAVSLSAGALTAQTVMPLPPYSSTFSAATLTRGYWFQSPANIVITGLQVPDESGHGLQNVEVFLMPSAPPNYPGTGSGVQVFYQTGVPSNQVIPTTILVNTGDYVGILGACGDTTTMRNSYSATGAFPTTILGMPVIIDRFLTQTNIVSSGGNQAYSAEPGFSIGRVEMTYTAQTGLFASFGATPTSGTTPLTVSFTDTSFTSDPSGIQTWAWDLDGDSLVDSNAPNPSFTYNTCGNYDVTLTVTDTQNPPSTRTVADFVQADPQLLVQASFSWAPGGVPLSVQFTDASAGSPTSWSWDLDGDSVPDSVQQNPLWVYGSGGSYNVTLIASNACGGTTARTTVTVIANDECTGAIPLALGLSGPYTNQGSTTSFGWPCAAGGSDVWYSYLSPCAGTLEINTCTGTTYDSSLEAFSGSCGALTPIICNDDSCGLLSRISFAVQPATTYYLRVGGYVALQGTFQLNLILTSTGNGAFATVFPGCGGSTLTTTGLPNLGATVGFNLSTSGGLPFLFIGTVPIGSTICPAGCILGTNFDVVLNVASFSAIVPCFSFLRGGQVYFQGAELGVAGGCTSGNPVQMRTSNTVRATIG